MDDFSEQYVTEDLRIPQMVVESDSYSLCLHSALRDGISNRNCILITIMPISVFLRLHDWELLYLHQSSPIKAYDL